MAWVSINAQGFVIPMAEPFVVTGNECYRSICVGAPRGGVGRGRGREERQRFWSFCIFVFAKVHAKRGSNTSMEPHLRLP